MSDLLDSLAPSLDVLRRAFPTGIAVAEYHALLAAMDGDYADEGLALVFAAAVTTARPAAADVCGVRELLSAAGYDELTE